MRVAVGTDGLYTARAGTARYIRGLLWGLERVADPSLEILPLGWPVENFSYRQPERWLKTLYREFLWAKVRAPKTLRQRRIDLLHSTNGLLIEPPPSTKHVVTLLDLTVIRFPERFRTWQRWSERWRLGRLAEADRVICISRFTADEAMSCLGLPAAKIDVVHLGVAHRPDGSPLVEEEPSFPSPDEFFLFVGTLEPGKNLGLLKLAYQLAESEGKPLPPLLIVGTRRQGVASEGEAPQGWHYVGWQPDAVLTHLYRRALALVFPSKYEGFGLPILEAMALGTPVLCSPVASLGEVAGDAAYLCELTPEAYRRSMARIATDATLRGELVAKGRDRVRHFSWERCARETLEVYREVAA